MKYAYMTQGTCSQMITFDLTGDKVSDIQYMGGCNGNLKAIQKLVDGFSVEQIEEKLLGNTCGMRGTSCTDQLAKAVRLAYEGKLEPFEDDEL